MDEQRAWIKSRRKKRLRLLAVALVFCLLFTTYPDILETLSVFAAGSQGEDDIQYISRFVSLPEEVREQTVPVGTGTEELPLPDRLEAVVVISEDEAPPEDAGEETEAPPEDAGEDTGEETEVPPEDTGEEAEVPPEDTGEETEIPPENAGEETEVPPEDMEEEAENPEEEAEDTDTQPEEVSDADNGDGQPEDTGESDDTEDKEGQDTQPEIMTTQESHTVTMPEYQAENVITVETLENTQESGTKEETVFIEGVTWQSEPAYDGNTEGTYLFTAVLPEGYALMEGASLPEITVTVQDSGEAAMIQALLDRIAALPDAKEYLAKEPDTEEEEAYEEWMEGLYEYAEEALAIQEEYEALTEEQRAQIPEEALDRLSAWVEIAEEIAGNSMVMAATVKEWEECGDAGSNVKAVLDADGTLTISGSGAMKDFGNTVYIPWYSSYRTQIKKVVIGSGVTRIGSLAFFGCSALENVTIPGSVTSIGGSAFEDCSALTGVVIPNGVTSIGYGAFNNCSSLTEVTIPASVTSIGGSAFQDCSELTKVVILKGVTSIGSGAFRSCSALKEVTIPGSVTSIGSNAFYGCSSLAEVTIPNSVTSIEFSAFNGCTSLATVTFEGTATIPTLGNNCFSSCQFVTNNEKGIKVPCQYLDAYKGQKGWSSYEDYIIGHSLTHVPAKAATCAVAGNTEYWKCSECGGLFSDSAGTTATTAGAVAIAKLAHSYSYAASGAVITETCDKGCGHSATATLSIPGGTDLTYTGSEITPVTVTYSSGWAGTGSNRPADSAISYSNNINAGNATAKLTVSGKTANLTFRIAQKPLTDNMVTVAPGPHYYTERDVTPAVTVKDGDTTLTSGKDYTVSYADNVNVGNAAKVKVTGKGNYTGSVEKTFTIECSPLPSGKSLTDYVTVSPLPNENGWYHSDITLTVKGGYGMGETLEYGFEPITITQETGTDGSTKTIYIAESVGIYQTEFSYKLDKTLPTVDLANMTVKNGTKDLWNWIIGKKSMIISIPASDITDSLSGIAEVTYTAIPENGAEQTKTISAQGGHYEIALDAEFTGTIRLTAEDRAGNTTQASLTAAGGKVIAEDYAPVVTFTTPEPNENGWYSTSFAITVAVTDDKDSGSAAIISGGIANIKWKDGENGTEQAVPGLPGTSPVCEKAFTISVNTDGTHTYYVQAVDNAGNESGWQTVTVSLDTSRPAFNGNLTVSDRTQEGAKITFTPSEGGKVYWIVSDTAAAPSAQEVKGQSGQKGGVQDILGNAAGSFTITGLAPGETHKVYAVLEDAAGNLSEVKEVSFTTLQKAPEIAYGLLEKDYGNETVKVPDSFGETEVYTDPSDPSGSRITPNADGSLPVTPGTTIYIRYPEKTEGGMTTPASDSTQITIPDRPAAPAPKQVTVTDTTAAVKNPAAGEEYVLVPKGQTPDWSSPDTTGRFTGLDPNKEYDLYVRKKATGSSFASEPVKTEIRTYVTIKEPVIEGEGAGKGGNTAPKPGAPDAGGSTVTYTGTYGAEYTPVIKTGGQEHTPDMTWDENSGKGVWEYTYTIPDGASEAGITVEFRKRTLTGLAVTPGSLTIHADDAANGSMDALTAYLKGHSSVQAAYDNQTKGAVTADYTTTGSFVPKGAVYHYTVSAGGKTKDITLTVSPVTASATAPDGLMKKQQDGGYTAAQVNAWLPAQVTVTYRGTGYTERTENRTVTWNTASIGTGFGAALGESTINGTVDLPAWATGQTSVSIVISFVDKIVLDKEQIHLTIPDFSYGAKQLPGPQGSVDVEDTNPAYTYLYSTDGGNTWVTEDRLPKSDGGYIIPGEYRVKMTYTGDNYTGEKTGVFTVTKKALDVLPGTLAVEDKNYDGNTDAGLKAGGQPVLSGVVTGDDVTLGGSLNAGFTEAGPKKDIPVAVTGFRLEGSDAGYYELKNTTLTLYATINNADGTPPSGSNGGNGSSGGNSGGGNSGSDDNEDDGSSGTPVDDNDPGTPVVTPAPVTVTPPADTQKPAPGTGTDADKKAGTQPAAGTAGQSTETETAETEDTQKEGTDTPGQDSAGPAQNGTGQQPDDKTVRTVPASVNDGRIVIAGGIVETGNLTEDSETTTLLAAGDGAVIVTVLCEDGKYAAGVKDTVAVANAVLTPEQIQLVGGGETIEVRIDIKDIGETVAGQDKEAIESGLMEYREELPGLTLGRYVDISLFIRIGEGSWDAVTSTEEPIEVVIGIPEELKGDGMEFYIIRSHEGAYTLLTDTDSDPDTITVSTDLFSAYALAYRQTDTGSGRCGLCHICPTFLGMCCFIWLAVVIIAILLVIFIILRRSSKKQEG